MQRQVVAGIEEKEGKHIEGWHGIEGWQVEGRKKNHNARGGEVVEGHGRQGRTSR